MSETARSRTTTATGADVRVRFCPSPTGTAARRPRPHRPVQLGVRAAHRRQVRLPHRRHGCRARQRGELPAAPRRAALARASTGTRASRSADRTRPTASRSATTSTATCSSKLKAAGTVYESYSTAEEIDARNEANGRAEAARLRQLRPRPHRRAAGRVPRRGPRAGAAPARARRATSRFDDLVRGAVDLPRRRRSTDFVVVRAERRAAVHVREPGRRRAHGHHARAARRGPPARRPPRQIALYRALIDVGVTTFVPRFGHLPLRAWARATRSSPSATRESNLFHHRERGFIPEGLLNYLSLLGWSISARPRRVLARRARRRVRHRRRQPEPGALRPEEGRVDQRRPHPDARAPPTSPRASCRTCRSPASSTSRRSAPRRRPCSTRPRRSCRSACSCSARRPGMLGFLFTDDELAYDDDALAGLPAERRRGARRIASARSSGCPTDVRRRRRSRRRCRGALDRRARAQAARRVRPAARRDLSGRRVSPPLFESMEILGKIDSLDRIDRLLARLG